MATERIDFISSYCDRWCKRCAFTDRCSAFACTLAIGMCGDVAAGIELAVGAPHPVDGTTHETAGAALLADFVEPSAEPMAEDERQEAARDARLDAAPLTIMATTYALRSTTWLKEQRHGIAAHANPIVREALDVVAWDASLIGAKVHRALDGRDRARHDEGPSDDDSGQSDTNGSAKVALMSLERSEAAWRVIGEATADSRPSALADAAAHLRRTVLREFPTAMSFIRPGFDEPGL